MLFKDVVGQEDLKKRLVAQVNQGRISHAQLFLGPEGSGNFQLALAYAQFLNCENKGDEDSCGKCNSCNKYQQFQHPDLSFIFPTATNDEVKKDNESKKFFPKWIEFLKAQTYFDFESWCAHLDIEKKQPVINVLDSLLINQSVTLKPYEAEYKVVLIWCPERMNLDCSNKILKTLEEPQDKSLILMVGHQSEALLPTIISRLQITKVPPVHTEDIQKGLLAAFQIDDQKALSLARLAEGNYYKATQLAQNPDADEQMILQFQTWVRLCYTLDIPKLQSWIDSMAKESRESQKRFLTYCLRMFHLCIYANYGSSDGLPVHHLEAKFMEKFARFIHATNITDFMHEFDAVHTAISRNGNAKIHFFSLSLKVCNFLKYKI